MAGVGGPRPSISALALALALAVAIPVSAGTAAPGAASANSPKGELFVVECPTATCLAIGSRDGTTLIAQRWNGKAWSTVPIGAPPNGYGDTIDDIACSSATRCFAVGVRYGPVQTALLERWDGNRWTQLTAPQPTGSKGARLTGVSCPTSTFCMASGVWDNVATQHSYSARWNGSAWTVTKIPRPANASVMSAQSVSCFDASTCFLVGRIVKSTAQTLVMQWNGTGWSRRPSPTPSGPHQLSLSDVSCPAPTFCFAVGWYILASHHYPFAVRWSGQTFSLMETAVPSGADQSVLDDVACASPLLCFTAGSSSQPHGETQPWIKRWDGKNWATVTTPSAVASRALFDVSCSSAKNCATVGADFADLTTPRTFAMRWSGAAWAISAAPSPS